MMSVCSASGTKRPGGSSPWVGCFHRTRASIGLDPAVAKVRLRLVVEDEFVCSDGAAQLGI